MTPPERRSGEATAVIGPARRCRGGHDQSRNPAWDPRLGMVPALSSVVVGLVLVAGVFALQWWLLPAAIPFTVGLLGIGLLFSAVIQWWLGHRGGCWVRRTLRWWLGPLGSLVDPFGMG